MMGVIGHGVVSGWARRWNKVMNEVVVECFETEQGLFGLTSVEDKLKEDAN